MDSQTIVDLLNQAVKADPSAMHALVVNRVPCTDALADHPTIVVDDEGTPGYPHVGLLGILNGITGLEGQTIEAVWDGEPQKPQEFVGFRLREGTVLK